LVYVAGLPCSEEAGLPRDSTTKPEFGLRGFWHVINEGISFSAYKRIRLSAYPELTLQRDRATKGAATEFPQSSPVKRFSQDSS
jgi:hypothetical protein